MVTDAPRRAGRLAPVAALGLGVAAGALGRRRIARAASPRPVAANGAVGRAAQVVGLSTQLGSSWGVHQARRTFASTERRIELDRDHQLRTVEQVTERLGNLKGGMMKLGQMASHLDPGASPIIRETLARLQDSAPPMAPELAASVIRQELGAPPDELFERWDPDPFAAASIGQVHRAITRDGRAVAVKVQYPGIDDAIRSDMRSASAIFFVLRPLFPGLDSEPLIREVTDRLVEEVDYELEADRQEQFRAIYDGHPHIHVPWVDRDLSTARVLTTELVAGASMAEARTWPARERDLAGETIYRFAVGSIYRHQLFNGDPHPGNYRFHGDGRVTFLDFGMVKVLSPADLDTYRKLSLALAVDDDVDGFRALLVDEGFLAAGAPLTDEQLVRFFGRFYEFVAHDRPVTITPEGASRIARSYVDLSGPDAPVVQALNIPPGLAILQRINLGLQAVLAELQATANWRRIAEEAWPWVDGPPASPLGLADAEWRGRASAAGGGAPRR
jgi:predicted unusual protein kinase regulating ubiquinone biosynthesis (AarF/ABC1/UbiB family)